MKTLALLRPLEILQVWMIGMFGWFIIGLPYYNLVPHYLLTLLLHITATYFLNDYYDWPADQKNPRRLTFSNRPHFLCATGYFLFIISTFMAFRINSPTGILFLALNLLGILYSAPPIRLKGKSPAPLLIHAFCGAFYFSGIFLTLEMPWELSHNFYAAFWALALATGSLFNEVLDGEPDQLSQIKTLGQSLSFTQAKKLLLGIHVIALVLFAIGLYLDRFYISLGVALILLVTYLKVSTSRSTTPARYRTIYRAVFSLVVLVAMAEAALNFIRA